MDARPQLQRRISSLRIAVAIWARPPPLGQAPADTTPAALRPSTPVAPEHFPEPERARCARQRPGRSARSPTPPTIPARQNWATISCRLISSARTAIGPRRKQSRGHSADTRSTRRTAEPEKTGRARSPLRGRSHPERSSPSPGASRARSPPASSRPASRSR